MTKAANSPCGKRLRNLMMLSALALFMRVASAAHIAYITPMSVGTSAAIGLAISSSMSGQLS